MSIMKTIMFPGDTEPREIQDSRIEIITIDNGKASLLPKDIQILYKEGKTIFLQNEPFLYILHPYANNGIEEEVEISECVFSTIQSIVDLGKMMGAEFEARIGINDSIIISEDGSINFLSESMLDTFQFYLPSVTDETLGGFLTNFSFEGLGVPIWAPLPIASNDALGMVKAIPATSEMTEYIGIDNNGQLRVAPSNDIETDETLSLAGYAADAQVVGNKLSSIPISVAEDGYTEINGLRQAVQIDIAKTDTQVSVVTTLESGEGEVIQNSSIIALNASGLPIKITTNETECVINWGEGF